MLPKQGTNIVQAIQVTYLLNTENLKRETDGLFEAMATYKFTNALLLYYDKDLEENRIPEGITALPVWKWLLTE